MTIKEMLEKRANIWDQAQAILQKARDEKRALSGEEQQQFDRMTAEMDEIKATVDREERAATIEAEMRKNVIDPVRPSSDPTENRAGDPRGSAEYRDAFFQWLRTENPQAPTEARSLLETKGKVEQRALSAVTGAAGAYTVPTATMQSIIKAMSFWGGLRRSRVRTLTTSTGNVIPWPTVNDTANKGARIAENTAMAEQDTTFGQKNLNAYMYTSKIIRIPWALLTDTAVDLEQLLRDLFAERIGRITNEEMTLTGTGVDQPEALVGGAALGKTGANGQTSTITYADLIDLMFSVDPVYRDNAEWMLHDTTVKAVLKMVDANGLPLWQPSLVAGAPDMILGKKYVVNSDVAAMGASAKSVLFGDFSAYVVRDVLDGAFIRLGERYAEYGQVAFVLWSRHDGRYITAAGVNPIKYYQNSAT